MHPLSWYQQVLRCLLPEFQPERCAWMQGDLWQWYLEPSLYGTEVLTLGGSRGPSVSYYVPYLSAMQLLLPLPSIGAAPSQHSGAPSHLGVPAAPLHHTQQQQQQQHQLDDPLQHGDAIYRGSAAHQRLADLRQQPAPGPMPIPTRVYHVEADWQCWPRQV